MSRTNREERLAYCREYYRKNKQKCLEYQRKYRLKPENIIKKRKNEQKRYDEVKENGIHFR